MFFFPVTLFGLPVTFFEKVPVTLEKCPWQKTPNFAREKWRVARDKIAKKVPVKNEKCPWQFLKFCPWQNKKCPWKTISFLSNFFLPAKVTLFTSWEKFIGHSFIQNPKIYFFCTKKGGKRQLLFWSPGKVLMPFIQSLMGFQLFYKKLVGIFFSKLFEFFYIMPGKVHISFINLISFDYGAYQVKLTSLEFLESLNQGVV